MAHDSRLQSIKAGKQYQEPKTIAPDEQEQRETNTCMLASLLMLASYTVQDPCLGNSVAYSGLDLPTSVNPRDVPIDKLNVDHPSLRLFPQVILSCVE